MSIKHKYETLMVFSLKDGEESAAPLVEKFKTLIEQNGTIDEFDEWGKRRLAYPINDEPEGHYVLVNYTCDADFPAELDRVFKITDGVLRWLIVNKD